MYIIGVYPEAFSRGSTEPPSGWGMSATAGGSAVISGVEAAVRSFPRLTGDVL